MVYIVLLVVLVLVVAAGIRDLARDSSLPITDCSELASRFDDQIHEYGFCTDYLSGKEEKVMVGGRLLAVNQTIIYPGSNVTYTLEFAGKDEQGSVYVILPTKDQVFTVGSFYRFDLMENCKYMKILATSYYPPYIPMFSVPEELECSD